MPNCEAGIRVVWRLLLLNGACWDLDSVVFGWNVTGAVLLPIVLRLERKVSPG